MVHDLGRRGFLGALMAAAVDAQAPPPASAGPADPALIEDLVAANRILYDQGVVDGFGHVSARHDKDPNRYLLSRSMAPALVTADDIMEFDLDSTPVDQRGRAVYLERFIHGEIYKVRPDVLAVVHSHSPAVIPYADTKVQLRPMNHIAGFLGGGVPVFEIRDVGGACLQHADQQSRARPCARGDARAAAGGADARPWFGGGGAVGAPRRVSRGLHRGERPHGKRGAAARRSDVPERRRGRGCDEDQRRAGGSAVGVVEAPRNGEVTTSVIMPTKHAPAKVP